MILTAVTTTGGQFTSGTFTAPMTGVYYISYCARCEQQACDVTVRWVYGNDITYYY